MVCLQNVVTTPICNRKLISHHIKVCRGKVHTTNECLVSDSVHCLLRLPTMHCLWSSHIISFSLLQPCMHCWSAQVATINNFHSTIIMKCTGTRVWGCVLTRGHTGELHGAWGHHVMCTGTRVWGCVLTRGHTGKLHGAWGHHVMCTGTRVWGSVLTRGHQFPCVPPGVYSPGGTQGNWCLRPSCDVLLNRMEMPWCLIGSKQSN